MNIFPQAVILSASQSKLHHSVNHTNHMELYNFLQSQKFGIKLVDDMYKGVKENSIFVQLNEFNDLERLKELVTKYNQESVLYLDSNRVASLHYCNSDKVDFLGKFTNVTEEVAKMHDCYTVDSQGMKVPTYWVTIK